RRWRASHRIPCTRRGRARGVDEVADRLDRYGSPEDDRPSVWNRGRERLVRVRGDRHPERDGRHKRGHEYFLPDRRRHLARLRRTVRRRAGSPYRGLLLGGSRGGYGGKTFAGDRCRYGGPRYDRLGIRADGRRRVLYHHGLGRGA